MLQCAKCPSFVCGSGDREHGPSFCPMLGEFPDTGELYKDPWTRQVVHAATQVEGVGYRLWTRAEEIMEFAWRLGGTRIGLAFCPAMSNEALTYARILEANGFMVVLAGQDEEQAAQHGLTRRQLSERDPLKAMGLSDPIGQADYCNEMKTDLNVILGLAVGHDSLFVKHANALSTCLIAKDSALGHNSAGAIYHAESYHQGSLLEAHTDGAASRTLPDAEMLPMPGEAYSDPEVRRVAVAADQVAFMGNPAWSRLEQTIEFARRIDATRIGVTFCVGSKREARTVTRVLEANGFQVSSVVCKTGGVSKETLGITDSDKVQAGKPEVTCNPIVQTELLKGEGTDLNITMGQCVGHDSLIMKHSATWVTYLMPKDRVLAHNPVAALYNADGHFRRALYEGDRPNGWKKRHHE